MFVFYSALLSAITPPVALAAYAGAAISGGSVMRTGVIASKLGFVKFLVPYMFVYNAAFLMIGSPLFIAWSFITGVAGTIALVVALEGYYITRMDGINRLIFAAVGLAALVPEIKSDLVGMVLFGILTWMNFKKSQSEKSELAEAI